MWQLKSVRGLYGEEVRGVRQRERHRSGLGAPGDQCDWLEGAVDPDPGQARAPAMSWRRDTLHIQRIVQVE